LDGIFGSERTGGWIGTQWHDEFRRGPEGNIRKWGELGLTGEWADKTINPVGPSLRYETALAFSDLVLQHSDKWNEHLHAYGNWKKPDGTTYGWAAHMMDLMKEDPYSIGIFMYSAAFSPALRVVALAKNEGEPFVDYSMESQQARTWPLWSEQSFYISAKPGEKPDPKIREFLRYVLSREGQEEVERDGKYLPLTSEVADEGLKRLNSL
jgi:phosphate transport system substrate-binding protein